MSIFVLGFGRQWVVFPVDTGTFPTLSSKLRNIGSNQKQGEREIVLVITFHHTNFRQYLNFSYHEAYTLPMGWGT